MPFIHCSSGKQAFGESLTYYRKFMHLLIQQITIRYLICSLRGAKCWKYAVNRVDVIFTPEY